MFDCYCDLLCYWMLLSLAMTQFHDPGLMFKRVQAKCPTLPRLAMNKSVPRTRAMMAVEPSGQSCSMRKSSSNSLQSSTSNLGICAFAASLVIVVPKVTDKGSLFETAKHPLPPLSLSLSLSIAISPTSIIDIHVSSFRFVLRWIQRAAMLIPDDICTYTVPANYVGGHLSEWFLLGHSKSETILCKSL